MLNNTVLIVDDYFHWIRFSKPQAHCCFYANIEYNIDRITTKINAAAKEDLKAWANEKSAAIVADFLAHDTKAVYIEIKCLILKKWVTSCHMVGLRVCLNF